MNTKGSLSLGKKEISNSVIPEGLCPASCVYTFNFLFASLDKIIRHSSLFVRVLSESWRRSRASLLDAVGWKRLKVYTAGLRLKGIREV